MRGKNEDMRFSMGTYVKETETRNQGVVGSDQRCPRSAYSQKESIRVYLSVMDPKNVPDIFAGNSKASETTRYFLDTPKYAATKLTKS